MCPSAPALWLVDLFDEEIYSTLRERGEKGKKKGWEKTIEKGSGWRHTEHWQRKTQIDKIHRSCYWCWLEAFFLGSNFLSFPPSYNPATPLIFWARTCPGSSSLYVHVERGHATTQGCISDTIAALRGNPESPLQLIMQDANLISRVPAMEVQMAQGYSAVAQEVNTGRTVLLNGEHGKLSSSRGSRWTQW